MIGACGLIYIASAGNAMVEVVREYAAARGDEVVIVSAQTESDLAQMSAEGASHSSGVCQVVVFGWLGIFR